MKSDTLDRLKEYPILDVARDLGFEVDRYRKLHCPFHQDDTPSLVFYPATNSFYCFGCGKSGNSLTLYSELAGLDIGATIREMALRYLPDAGGGESKGWRKRRPVPQVVRPPKTEPPPTSEADEARFSAIYEALRDVCLQQPTNELSEQAAGYLASRGFTEKTLRDFRIFTIADYAEASWHLKARFSTLDLRESGLYNDKDNLIFYKHPILIPYYRDGRIVYLQGRVIGQPEPNFHKYMWLVGRPLTLFNADLLKTLKLHTTVHVTEGAFDCMTLVQEGMPAVGLGSANVFKKEWAKGFRRYDVCFYLDNDAAGHRAADELEPMLQDLGIVTSRKYLPAGFKDVNEYFVAKGGGQGSLF
jgi:DNA primase